jgi:hypothetical protein
MTSLEDLQTPPSQEDIDRFARADRVVRLWWVAIFLTLIVTAWLVRGVSA